MRLLHARGRTEGAKAPRQGMGLATLKTPGASSPSRSLVPQQRRSLHQHQCPGLAPRRDLATLARELTGTSSAAPAVGMDEPQSSSQNKVNRLRSS
jgi:hypothetical protein